MTQEASNGTGRGRISPEVQEAAVRMLGREITTRELRLIPYVQYVLVNDRRIERVKVNEEEIEILGRWESAGWITLDFVRDVTIEVTKEFWNAMHEILWAGYARPELAR